MKYFIVLLVYFIFQIQGLTNYEQDALGNIENRIMNGTITEQEEFPWHAAIAVEQKNGVLLCGGSLIGTQWIVTAAQCIDGAISYSIGLGKNNLDSYETSELIVSEFGIKHEYYSEDTKANNIGLIKLPKPIFFSDSINKTILANWKTNLSESVLIAGYGRSELDEYITPQQTYLELNTISNERCTNYYDQIITPFVVCAKPLTKNQGVCNNDYGGGLVQKVSNETRQIGIFSFYHTEGCNKGSPFVFTRVSPYITWINNKTGLNLDDGNSSILFQINKWILYLSTIFLLMYNNRF